MPKSAGGSNIVEDLGLGDMLSMQVGDETDETRKKRMAQKQTSQMGAGGSLAVMSLLGGGMGGLGA